MEALLNKYLHEDEKLEFLEIVKPIFLSEEFKRRCTKEFPHHDNFTLGEHILEVAMFTYLECKKRTDINLETAVMIAMMHDLYTLPWQNNPNNRVEYFFNKHGFRHPIEAVINAVNWYPEVFNKYDGEVIIDGIVHHMFPMPVRAFNERDLELKNEVTIEGVYKDLLIESSNRCTIGDISFCRSRFKEGRVVSKGDRKSTRIHLQNVESLTSGVTGYNRNLKA